MSIVDEQIARHRRAVACDHRRQNASMYRCDDCGLTKEEIVRRGYITDQNALPVAIGSVTPVIANGVEDSR